jgi:hypothetical protein
MTGADRFKLDAPDFSCYTWRQRFGGFALTATCPVKPQRQEEGQNMKKMASLICGIFLVIALASCATYPLPITATGNPVGKKVGEASGKIYFGAFGDASEANIAAAARNGNITQISTIDLQVNNFLFVVQTITCVVTGE